MMPTRSPRNMPAIYPALSRTPHIAGHLAVILRGAVNVPSKPMAKAFVGCDSDIAYWRVQHCEVR